ncbi:MAG: glucose-6-phosphate dehydrogenase [Terriglobia bacterium]|nr:glucose-6-phosphate dehydrogenase [Terriglobia bacterium]
MSTVIQANTVEKPKAPPLPVAEPCLMVIFGASGDLTRRKLIPALFDLACVGCMNPFFQVIGTGRTEMTDDAFRQQMHDAAKSSRDARDFNDLRWDWFAERLHYVTGDIKDPKLFSRISARLDTLSQASRPHNRLFYVSTPASLAPPIVAGLGDAGLNHHAKGWARVILEKPFGRDLQSARALNLEVLKVFGEEDIYRIDHYLGKETVQNILVFRFGNSIFEPVWNRNYVDYVEITAAETVGVENRAAFYEETGALRDMVANHLLQLTALTAMEPPIAFEANAVREQKVQLFRSIRPMTVEEVAKRTVRGQYGPGTINGKPVPGYREEKRVNPQSHTETFAAVEFYIDNWRWAGVPFFIRTGKRLARPMTEIRVHFKRTPQALFARTPDEEVEPNVITLTIQPNEGISISFGAKYPGSQMKTVPVRAEFDYGRSFGTATPVAYETLLLDAMRGDATLFTRGDEIEAEWRIITPIEEAWAQLPPPSFPNYAAGSDGPESAQSMIRGDHRRWRSLDSER